MGKPTNLVVAPTPQHIPVLLHEVLAALHLHPGGHYVDATVGGGGHAQAILRATAPDGYLLGLDRDPEATTRAIDRLAEFGRRVKIINAAYVKLAEMVAELGLPLLDGVLFDLGFSSWQIDDARRGFSFRRDGPLDMRFDVTEATPSAEELVNQLPTAELADILWRYGEESRSRRIAQAIVAARPIYGTQQLAEVVASTARRAARARLHPATRTFQALRIAVNHELVGLTAALPQAIAALVPGGRLAVIAFHSLEDRIVKQFFRQQAHGCQCPPESPVCTCGLKPSVRLVTRKLIRPTAAEIRNNPRSRSAKLRVVEKL